MVKVEPVQHIWPIKMVESRPTKVSVESICSKLPRSVAERQLFAALDHLLKHRITCRDNVVGVEDARSPGTSILVYSTGDDGPYLGGDAIGERGKPAETVGLEAATIFLREWKSAAPIDAHLGDMLVHLLCLAPGPSTFRVSRATEHLRTNLHVAEVFTGRKHGVEEAGVEGATICIDAQ